MHVVQKDSSGTTLDHKRLLETGAEAAAFTSGPVRLSGPVEAIDPNLTIE